MIWRSLRWIPLALLLSCRPAEPPPCGELDDLLRLHHVQALGTHNSYHLEPESPVDDSHRYSHAPLFVQLDELGVRQLELDLHLRAGEGFEVFHLPVIDQETTCRRFVDCLDEIRRWSSANGCHLPLMIWLEPKDDVDPLLDPSLEPIEGRYADLEAEILSVFPTDQVVTPDEVRGDRDTLAEAIRATGWPTLGELRGRVIFSMLDHDAHREAYLAESPDLSGRLLFVDADATDRTAAAFKINDASAGAEEVSALAAEGFVITSNADGVGEAPEDNRARAEASLAAGAHFLSTDFPQPGGDYWLEIPEGAPARCNPRTAPPECRPEHIEDLR